MTDETAGTAAPPATLSMAERVWLWVKAAPKAFFSPIQSLWSARAWWQYAIIVAIFVFFVSVRSELKAILLTGFLALPCFLFGYIARKNAHPEIKVRDLMEGVKSGNAAAGEVVKTSMWVQAIYSVLVFIGVIYLLPYVYDKIK
ncbi:MAG: hypothetical protein ACRDAM_15800 [Casimicrobium sp.]